MNFHRRVRRHKIQDDFLNLFIQQSASRRLNETSVRIAESDQIKTNIHRLEFRTWLARNGILPEAGLGVSRAGFYADFI